VSDTGAVHCASVRDCTLSAVRYERVSDTSHTVRERSAVRGVSDTGAVHCANVLPPDVRSGCPRTSYRHDSASAIICALPSVSSRVFVIHTRVAPTRQAIWRILPPAV
jgi:hypothetical protein